MHIIYFIFCFGEWISNCLFRASRGLRQINLLSLFLFTFVAETFVVHVMKARDLGFILVYEVCNGSLWKITNSKREFVDSTTLFCLATSKEFLMLKSFLRCFEVASVWKIILSKTIMVGVGCPGSSALIGLRDDCKVEKLPIKYLCLPIGGNLRSTTM